MHLTKLKKMFQLYYKDLIQIKMPRHPDFEELYYHFVSQYGKEDGEKIYYAYLHNEELKEEIALNVQKDAIENNFTKIQKSLNQIMISEKEKYALIIDRFISDTYNEGLKAAAIELSMLPSEFGNIREKEAQIKILRDNSKNLLFNLLDSVEKEITLFLTNTNLNNIPFTNVKLKQEIINIFSKYDSRLKSQVISETDRAFNTALEFGYKKSGLITHKQVIAVIDGKTSSICQSLNGEIVEIGQPFSSGDYTPPFHPNCRSRIVGISLV